MPGNFAGHFGFGTYINVITINSNNKNVGYKRNLICYNPLSLFLSTFTSGVIRARILR
jgi:hypothetical protein